MTYDIIASRITIDPQTKCWIWDKTKFGNYGTLRSEGKTRKAHRFVFEAFVGEIPDGLVIDHLCRVKTCVNPTHLEAVTQAENIRRGVGATVINSRKTECVRGHPLSGGNIDTSKGWRRCLACDAIRQAEWRKRNHDRQLAYERRWRHENREKIRAYHREWRRKKREQS